VTVVDANVTIANKLGCAFMDECKMKM